MTSIEAKPWPRSMVAVFAGLVLIVVLSMGVDAILHGAGVFPPMGTPMATSLWILATAYRIVFSAAGCYLAARLARANPMRHAMILGWIGVVISTLGTIATWNKGPESGPKWYPISLNLVALPCAWLGGKLAEMRNAKRSVLPASA